MSKPKYNRSVIESERGKKYGADAVNARSNAYYQDLLQERKNNWTPSATLEYHADGTRRERPLELADKRWAGEVARREALDQKYPSALDKAIDPKLKEPWEITSIDDDDDDE